MHIRITILGRAAQKSCFPSVQVRGEGHRAVNAGIPQCVLSSASIETQVFDTANATHRAFLQHYVAVVNNTMRICFLLNVGTSVKLRQMACPNASA